MKAKSSSKTWATIRCRRTSVSKHFADPPCEPKQTRGATKNRRASSSPESSNKMSERKAKRTVGWMGIQRGHKARPLEWLVEKAILAISFSAILMILLIFLFIGREALPILLGRM